MSRSFGETSLTSRSPMRISPEVASRPATIRSAVVLPHPDGPTSTRNSLSRISRLTLLTAMTFLNVLVRLRRVTPAIDTLLCPLKPAVSYGSRPSSVKLTMGPDASSSRGLRSQAVEESDHLPAGAERQGFLGQGRLLDVPGRAGLRGADQGEG